MDTTFHLGLTEKQRRDREGVVLPYFDAQRGEGGEGGLPLLDVGFVLGLDRHAILAGVAWRVKVEAEVFEDEVCIIVHSIVILAHLHVAVIVGLLALSDVR